MKQEFDSWIVDVLDDIQTAMYARNFYSSAEGIAHVRKQLANDIRSKHEAATVDTPSNVIQLLPKKVAIK